MRDEPFRLLPAKRERKRERFEAQPARQMPLFIGADDLPGQGYLIDPFSGENISADGDSTAESRDGNRSPDGADAGGSSRERLH